MTEKRDSSLIFFAGLSETKKYLEEKNTEALVSLAKNLYEKESGLRRVMFLDGEGIAIGVYPRDSLVQGTNFSSRDYFQKTKELKKGYISQVFEGIKGKNVIVQTQPVFEGNEFVGLVAFVWDLESIAPKYSSLIGEKFKLFAVDGSGRVVFSSDNDEIGSLKKVSFGDNYSLSFDSSSKITIGKEMANPNWRIYAEGKSSEILRSYLDNSLLLVGIFLANSFFSIWIAMLMSYPKERKVLLPPTNLAIPVG